jgi:hypothetical protein
LVIVFIGDYYIQRMTTFNNFLLYILISTVTYSLSLLDNGLQASNGRCSLSGVPELSTFINYSNYNSLDHDTLAQGSRPNKSQEQKQLILRPTVSWPVLHGVGLLFGAHDQTIIFLYSEKFLFLHVGRPL